MEDKIVEIDGTVKYYKDEKLHKENGPAVIRPNGTKYWFKEGEYHRLDGPAIIRYFETMDGVSFKCSESWYKDGKLHCETGYAVNIFNEQGKLINYGYYLENKEYNYDAWKLQVRKYKIKNLLNKIKYF